MYLEIIKSPSDLKKLDRVVLKVLAEEIRARIIEVITHKGGHLASSLGAVELCIALHYCLHTPADTLVFDVGHQSYAHKLLTGRNERFASIREYGGISGFPNRNESVYDAFSVGHASNAISLALGVAEGMKALKESHHVVAVVGDGSLSGGECFEALNNAGHLQSDLIVIFNHNEMSIAPSVGALSSYLNKIISLPVYNRLREGIDTLLKKVPHLAKKIIPRIHKVEEVMKGLVVPGIFFEELGFRYFGPLDGHNLDELIPTLQNVLALKGPRLIHVVTKKGKGYKPAERNPEIFHSAPKFSRKIIQEENKIALYTDVFSEKILSCGKINKKVVALTAAMCQGTGLEPFAKHFPKRFFDAGIAEAHLVSFSSGLATKGFIPFVCVYSTFLQRAIDQIIEDVALQEQKVIFIIDRAGLVGEDGPTHHGIFDIAYLRTIPNMVIGSPRDGSELEGFIDFALAYPGPVAIRFPKGAASFPESPGAPIVLGRSELLREGNDCVLLAFGSMVEKAVEVGERLSAVGISARVVNARFAKPLDQEMLEDAAQRYPLIVTLEEGVLEGGFGAGVLELIAQKNLMKNTRIVRLGIPSQFVTFGARDVLLEQLGLSANKIFQTIYDLHSQQKNQNGEGQVTPGKM